MRLNLTTAPTVEPLTLVETKAHLRVDHTDEDDRIHELIVAARERAERETNRALLSQTWELLLDAFPGGAGLIVVPRPPLRSVSSITYVDTAGDVQTCAQDTYQVSSPAGPYAARGRILPAYGQTWPQTRPETLDAVTVTFVAGYGTSADNAPRAIRTGMLWMVEAWFTGDTSLLQSASNLLVPYKSRALCQEGA